MKNQKMGHGQVMPKYNLRMIWITNLTQKYQRSRFSNLLILILFKRIIHALGAFVFYLNLCEDSTSTLFIGYITTDI